MVCFLVQHYSHSLSTTFVTNAQPLAIMKFTAALAFAAALSGASAHTIFTQLNGNGKPVLSTPRSIAPNISQASATASATPPTTVP